MLIAKKFGIPGKKPFKMIRKMRAKKNTVIANSWLLRTSFDFLTSKILLYKHNFYSEASRKTQLTKQSLSLNYRSLPNSPVFALITSQVHIDVYDR